MILPTGIERKILLGLTIVCAGISANSAADAGPVAVQAAVSSIEVAVETSNGSGVSDVVNNSATVNNSSQTYAYTSPDYGTVILATGGTPSAAASAYVAGNPFYSTAGSSLAYYLEIESAMDTSVLVHASAKLTASITPGGGTNGLAVAYLDMFSQQYEACAGQCGGSSTTNVGIFTYGGAEIVDYSAFLPTNTLFSINVGTSVSASYSSFAYAFADPIFWIDGSVPNSTDYTVVLSDGVGNSQAVPEPASSAIFSTAFMGFLALRQRRRVAGHAHHSGRAAFPEWRIAASAAAATKTSNCISRVPPLPHTGMTSCSSVVASCPPC